MVIDSLANITGQAIVRHGAAAANALGLTTQVAMSTNASLMRVDQRLY
jgi:hypothetical protein